MPHQCAVLVALIFIDKEGKIVLNILGHDISKTHVSKSISSSFVFSSIVAMNIPVPLFLVQLQNDCARVCPESPHIDCVLNILTQTSSA